MSERNYTNRELIDEASTWYDLFHCRGEIGVHAVSLISHKPNARIMGLARPAEEFLNNGYGAHLKRVESMREQVMGQTPLFKLQSVLYNLAYRVMRPRTLSKVFRGPALVAGLDNSIITLTRVGQDASNVAYPPASADVAQLILQERNA